MKSQDGALIGFVKAIHTLIWFVVEACMVYVLAAGLRGRSDRRVGVAAAVVAAESVVFLGNGAKCPLTGVVERLGSDEGGVTDIFLPRWVAHALPAIHVPMIVAAIWLHWRNSRH